MASCKILSFRGPHVKCRNSAYPRDPSVLRHIVPDDKVSWSVPLPDYNPVQYSHPKLATSSWADPDILVNKQVKIEFNTVSNGIDRRSFHGLYKFDQDGLPLNVIGRTGIRCRGALGRWGPNHAGDPIVTRWKRDSDGRKVINPVDEKPILQFVSILRGDVKEWAIPGGMVDPGESVTSTMKREFSEEALDSTKCSPEELESIKHRVEEAFVNGVTIYSGYVDDPRNTDNAWMETVATNYHDETSDGLGKFPLKAGDDAKDVCWKDISSDITLYASHKSFIQAVCERLGASF